jgi:hypothetical protein
MAPKAATPTTPKFYFVSAGQLDSVKLDKREQVDDAKTLFELLTVPIADPCLRSLRRIMSLTYFESLERTGEICLAEIRSLAIKTLGELGTELESLGLRRVDLDRSYRREQRAQVLQYLIVPDKALRRRVRVKSSTTRPTLAEVFQPIPADPAIRALREILSLTFTEATTSSQQDRVLEDIRYLAAVALVPCNPILEEMEMEPVAMPTWRRFVDGVDTFDGPDDSGDDEDDDGDRQPPIARRSAPAPQPAKTKRR